MAVIRKTIIIQYYMPTLTPERKARGYPSSLVEPLQSLLENTGLMKAAACEIREFDEDPHFHLLEHLVMAREEIYRLHSALIKSGKMDVRSNRVTAKISATLDRVIKQHAPAKGSLLHDAMQHMIATRQIRLTLTTKNNRRGVEILGSRKEMVWNREGDDQTELAKFEVIDGGGNVIDDAMINGDQWRIIEDCDRLDDLLVEVMGGGRPLGEVLPTLYTPANLDSDEGFSP